MIKTNYELETSRSWGTLRVQEIGEDEGIVVLEIRSQAFFAEDIQELIEFLKKLQRQLEQGDVDG